VVTVLVSFNCQPSSEHYHQTNLSIQHRGWSQLRYLSSSAIRLCLKLRDHHLRQPLSHDGYIITNVETKVFTPYVMLYLSGLGLNSRVLTHQADVVTATILHSHKEIHH